jgi:dephospho-CoA kinase
MRRILLTGMSGTGKSAVVEALVGRGFKAMDTDYGWCEEAVDGEWLWSEQRIQETLSTEDADVLLVAGCASNQVKFYDQFDLVVLLSAPAAVMVERIRNRSGNPFGKSQLQLAQVLGDLESVEPLLRKVADAEVATDRPLDEVVDDIVRLCASLSRSSSQRGASCHAGIRH